MKPKTAKDCDEYVHQYVARRLKCQGTRPCRLRYTGIKSTPNRSRQQAQTQLPPSQPSKKDSKPKTPAAPEPVVKKGPSRMDKVMDFIANGPKKAPAIKWYKGQPGDFGGGLCWCQNWRQDTCTSGNTVTRPWERACGTEKINYNPEKQTLPVYESDLSKCCATANRNYKPPKADKVDPGLVPIRLPQWVESIKALIWQAYQSAKCIRRDVREKAIRDYLVSNGCPQMYDSNEICAAAAQELRKTAPPLCDERVGASMSSGLFISVLSSVAFFSAGSSSGICLRIIFRLPEDEVLFSEARLRLHPFG